jgi:hypothetical protein
VLQIGIRAGATKLGPLGLMKESLKNLVREPLRVTPYLTLFIRNLFKPLLKTQMRLHVIVICFEILSCVFLVFQIKKLTSPYKLYVFFPN